MNLPLGQPETFLMQNEAVETMTKFALSHTQ